MQQTQIKKKKKKDRKHREICGSSVFRVRKESVDVGVFHLAAEKRSNEPVPFYCCRR